MLYFQKVKFDSRKIFYLQRNISLYEKAKFDFRNIKKNNFRRVEISVCSNKKISFRNQKFRFLKSLYRQFTLRRRRQCE